MTSPKTLPASPAPATRDPDLLKVGDALQRSARKALDLARQTGTPCYVWQDGKIVHIAAPESTTQPARLA